MANSRPGGRSARVQVAVFEAVARLRVEHPEVAISVPQVAAEAGVTASTIYRRWGGMTGLLAVIAAGSLVGDEGPADTGTLEGDVLVWARAYADELGSQEGSRYLRELVAGSAVDDWAAHCGDATRDLLQIVVDRGRRRGDFVVEPQALVDGVAAPVLYAILFDRVALNSDQVTRLVRRALNTSR